MVDLFALYLFRRHVPNRAERRAGFGDLVQPFDRRQSEVEQFGATIDINDNILWLDITVGDTALVRLVQSF